MTRATSGRRPRSDAVRNRALLIDAAAAAFREDGLGASVNAIAERAGVNIATLYRHFPTKEHLIGAVLDAVLAPLVAARDRALAGEGPVLATFLHEAVRLQAANRGLVDALAEPSFASALRSRLRAPALAAVEPLVERAHAAGELRADFGARDLLIALRMLSTVAGRTEIEPDRYVDVVLRGLRP